MTLDEISALDRPMLLATEVAPVLGCDPQWVRDTARDNPDILGFPTVRIGTRTRIPRIPFLAYMGYTTKEEQQ